MKDQEGPTLQHIPASSYQSCMSCKYYKRRMARSGRDPIYTSDCEHPDYPDKLNRGLMIGNLPNGYHTPDSCPILALKRVGGI